jgi:dienelactone hydrolase
VLDVPSDGIGLHVFHDPPNSPGKRPAVIFLHGGFAFGDGDMEMAQPFRDAGFVVVMPVLRGENGQAGDFTLYYDEVADVLAVADALGSLEHVDTNNLFVAGHSAGGTLATLSALASNKFRAAASFSGSMNQGAIVDDPDSEWLVVFDTSDPREVQMRSPEAYAGSFKCPARLYYGDEEDYLKDANERTATSAASRGLDVQAVRVPGNHFTSVDPAIRESIAFFRQHISTAPAAAAPASEPPVAADRGPPDTAATTPQSGPQSGPSRPTLPSMPFRPPPTFPPPIVPPSQPPSLPPASSTSFNRRPVVVFQVLDYTGAEDKEAAARQALAGVPWADLSTLLIDEEAGEIVFGVKGGSVSTFAAKSALERAGFKLGRVAYRPSGR